LDSTLDLTKLRGPQRRELPGGLRVEESTDETLTFSFSSEAPVDRWFGREILVHEEGAMDLSRMNDGAPWLWNHERNTVLGVVEKGWLGDDRRLYSTVRWSPNTTERGSEEWKRRQDIEAGITRNVSFAYEILKVEERKGDPAFYVTEWNVLEVSSVSVPADQTVGLGRAMDDPWVEPEPAAEPTPEPPAPAEPTVTIDPELVKSAVSKALHSLTTQTAERTESSDPIPMTTETINVEEVAQNARQAERERVASIKSMCDQFQLPELAEKLINDEASIDAARGVVMQQLGMRKVQFEGRVHDAGAGEIGLSKREVKRYSFLRVAQYLADPNPRTAEAAGFELEVARAAQAKHSRSANGVLIPWEVLGSNRAAQTPGQVVGTFGDGGALVGTDRLDAQFIDLIRNRSAFLNSGLTMLSGLEGNVEIPKKLSSSQYYFVGENADVTNSKLTFGLVNMIPRTIGVRVPISRRMMIQSSPDVENLVRIDMAESVALGMDYTIGYGTGSNGQPRGIIETTGIGSVTLGGGTAKAFPVSLGGDGSTTHNCGDWADYVDLETELAIDNLDASSMSYVMNSVVRGALKQTLRASSAGSDYIMTDAGTVNGYPTVISNQMQINDVLFGNFADCVVGMWSGLDVVVDPYTQSASGQVILTVHQDFDVAVRRPQSFALGT
jgi:HK97 family phage major capsid protein